MKVSVIGLGYVGFPLALQIASRGYDVKGVDINIKIIEDLKKNILPINDSFVESLFPQSRFSASDTLKSSDIYVVCVPTPVNERNYPVLNPLCSAIESISKVIGDNQLVIIESTIYPGTCEEIVKPILDKSGKKYYLAHCPERINPTDSKWTLEHIPRVVGGIDKESSDKAAQFYRFIISASVHQVSHVKEAEATKIIENTFRDINVAFVNEMAQSFYRMGIDIKEVIDAASTKPFGFMAHYPGTGVGGHCIAVDPYYMIEKGRESGFDHEFLKLARKINSNMPIYAVYLIQNMLNKLSMPIKGTKIGIYGLAYKPNVKDDRESPSYDIIKRLKQREADLIIYDPFLPDKSNVSSLDMFLQSSDAMIISTAHKEMVNVDYSLFKKYSIKLIIDGRNCLNKEKIKEMGIVYRGIGRE